MAGVLDSIMPAFLSRREPETPYSGNNGLFGLFGDGTAGRLGLAGATLMNLANNKPFDTSTGLMALNEQDTKRKELERKYKAAMRYADKIQESNPEYADQIRNDWTIASFMQQEKLKHELDPTTPYRVDQLKQSAALDAAKVQELQNQEQLMREMGILGGNPAPGTPPAGGQVLASPPGASVGGMPTPGMIGGTPDTPPQAPQQPPSVGQAVNDRATQMLLNAGIQDPNPGEISAIRNAMVAAAMDNEKDFTKVSKAVQDVIAERRAARTYSQEQEDRAATKANRQDKLEALASSGLYNEEQLNTFAGNDAMLNKTFEEFTTRNSDPRYARAEQLALTLKGVTPEAAKVMAGNPEMVASLVQKQIENSQNPNSESALRSRILGGEVNVKYEPGKPPQVTVPEFVATPEQRARLSYEFGLAPISATTARRIYNSPDGIAAEAAKVRNEQREDSKTSTDRAIDLNKQYRKAKEKNAEIRNLAVKASQELASGNFTTDSLTKHPEKGMTVLYEYIKVLDPDSAVREGEMALARQMETYLQFYNNELSKYGLKFDKNGKPINPHVVPPSVVQGMVQEIIAMGRHADNRLQEIDADYVDMAKSIGADPAIVVGKGSGSKEFNSSTEEFYKEHGGKVDRSVSPEESEEARAKYERENGPQSNTGYD